MTNKTTLKIAEAAVKSAPRFTEDADLLISQIARDLNLELKQSLHSASRWLMTQSNFASKAKVQTSKKTS